MKTLLKILPVLLLAACERPADPDAVAEYRAELEALAEAQRAAEVESERLAAETERLEAEKDQLEQRLEVERREREEAAMAVREREAADALEEAGRREEEAARQAEALAEEEAELAAREQELSERELELAGREALEDWSDDEPAVLQEPVADYDLFYENLDDHGQWFDSPDYGYIFQPMVVIRDRSWRPYTHGRWICTDRGWTWISEEPFGWATYHYGRWVLLSGRGWCWVPGGEWAPAWVAWRHGGNHVGWAPLPPETLGGHRGGWGVNADIDLGIADEWFCFVAERHFADPIWRHCLPTGRNAALRRVARGCTNLHYQGGRVILGGPSYAELRRHVGRPWPVCRVENEPLRGLGTAAGRRTFRDGDRCHVFAPNLAAPWNPGLRPNRVAARVDDVEVVRAPGGISAQWSERFRQARERQREAVRTWANRVRGDREERLASNREEVREALDRQTMGRGGRGSIAGGTAGVGGRSLPSGMTPMAERERALDQIRDRMNGNDARHGSATGGRREENGGRTGGSSADVRGAGRGEEATDRREAERNDVPRLTLQERLRQQNQAAAERFRQQQERLREARQGTAADRSTGRGGTPARNDANDRAAAEAAARRQQEEAARDMERQRRQAADDAARQAQADRAREAREEAARRQEDERRRMAERQRQAQEAAALRARQQQAREEAARRQAEQQRQAREDAARRAQEARARQAREEAARRAQEERARQNREQQRRAAEERARRAAEQVRQRQEAQKRQQQRQRELQEQFRKQRRGGR